MSTAHNNNYKKENDTSDPFFQKNAPIAQDLHEDLKKELKGDDNKNDKDENSNDANRRTLDESKVVEDDEDESN